MLVLNLRTDNGISMCVKYYNLLCLSILRLLRLQQKYYNRINNIESNTYLRL